MEEGRGDGGKKSGGCRDAIKGRGEEGRRMTTEPGKRDKEK